MSQQLQVYSSVEKFKTEHINIQYKYVLVISQCEWIVLVITQVRGKAETRVNICN